MDIVLGLLILFAIAYLFEKLRDILDCILHSIFDFFTGKLNTSLDKYEEKRTKGRDGKDE